MHRGEIVGPGDWPAAIDPDTWRAVGAMLRARPAPKRRDGRKYLLSGLLTCGACNAGTLGGKTRPPQNPAYVCRAGNGCRLARAVAGLDAYVTARVVDRLAEIGAAGHLDDDGDPGAERHALRAQLDTLAERLSGMAEDYADGLLTREQLRAGTERLRTESERLSAELETRDLADHPSQALAGLTGPAPATTFASLPLERQRAVVSALFESITVLPTTQRGRAPFDPSAVVLVERGRAGVVTARAA
jgi:hypothetical protein